MRLFIAEKPSLARAIAEGLGKGGKDAGCIRCGSDVVTWCFGHVLKQCDPEDYKPEYESWRREYLPIIPATWRNKAQPDAAAQLKIIGKLLKEAKSVVNAGDPDREGQLLVDEVLEHFAYKGPVARIWLASLDDRSVRKALDSITDNAAYAPLRDAARARSQADWLIGINATRAMTFAGRETGRSGVLSLGGVQTPTLALVVARDREIAAFRPADYFVLRASLGHDAGSFAATWLPGETQVGLDNSGRLADAAVASAIAGRIKGANGVITAVTRENKTKPAPLPHCLSSLQKEASSKFGLTAKQVLDTAQSLYEKKLTTYPRTDCRYLPEEQFDAAGQILATLSSVPGLEQVAGKADAKLKSAAWNTKKITAHHAIIPTGEVPGNLTSTESGLFLMIALAYSLQFYPAMRYEAQKIVLAIADTQWEARGRLILEAGWSKLAAEEEDGSKEDGNPKEAGGEDEAAQALPSAVQGDAVRCLDVETLKKKTTPPLRFTEGTLIEGMANVHRFVTDAAAKSVLRENEGIGTEATRASILETLKKRGYLKADKKAIVSTQLGQEIIDLTPLALKDPVTTATWESKLTDISQGKATLSAFMAVQVRVLPDLLALILGPDKKPAHTCPDCGQALYRRPGKKSGEWFWGCSGYPGCTVTCSDDNGKPGAAKKKPELSQYSCKACGKALVQRSGPKGEFFGCSAYPKCRQTYQLGQDGAPDFGGKK